MNHPIEPTPCDCCSGTAFVGLECRTRGGVAVLIGFDEFSVSSPPKKYRTKTVSGSAHATIYSDGACTTATDFTQDTFTGSCHYTDDGVLHEGMTYVFENGGSTITTVGCFSPGIGHAPLGDTSTHTSTQRNAVPGTGCHPVTGGYGHRDNNSCMEILSSEDTEANAKRRVLDANPWVDWEHNTGDLSVFTATSCASVWEIRTTGFTFTYIEAQYRVSASGTRGQLFSVTIVFGRRSIASGDPFAEYATTTQIISIGPSGTGFAEGNVPIQEGYATCVLSWTISSA